MIFFILDRNLSYMLDKLISHFFYCIFTANNMKSIFCNLLAFFRICKTFVYCLINHFAISGWNDPTIFFVFYNFVYSINICRNNRTFIAHSL